jgi:peptidoglycan/xylan/chitin deacetylase (PgdA/CDA1 family)
MKSYRTQYRNDAFSFWKLPEELREALGSTIATSEAAARYYLFEEYVPPKDNYSSALMNAYYKLKRLIPQAARRHLNYIAIRARGQHTFPHWPCESALLDLRREWLHSSLRKVEVTDVWHIGFWPDGYDCCAVLTHDVESPTGMRRMERIADIEEKHGFRSSWNLPLAQFEIDWSIIERLRARGFEIGAHGLAHDGKLFRSREDFDQLMPQLRQLAAENNLRGFRAPSTLRNADWIATMRFDYDSSFADTDPYEPQPGGTCSIFPFHLGNLVELPYTLPQDHTLIHLLRKKPIDVWSAKIRWIQALGGMILALTHPDYLDSEELLGQYEELLKELQSLDSVWRALPHEVAAWWRERSGITLQVEDGVPQISGKGSERAQAQRISIEPLAQSSGHQKTVETIVS